MSPVENVRDPRMVRLWTKYKEADLPVPKFKVVQSVTPPDTCVNWSRVFLTNQPQDGWGSQDVLYIECIFEWKNNWFNGQFPTTLETRAYF